MKKLADILLQHFNKGDKLYSPLFTQPLTFDSIDASGIHCIYQTGDKGTAEKIKFDLYGRYISGQGACVLFPSNEELNWYRYREDLPSGTPVMVKYGKEDTVWHLAWYKGNKTVLSYPISQDKMEIGTECIHIVPVDKFKFEDATFHCYDDYGLASKWEICNCMDNVWC